MRVRRGKSCALFSLAFLGLPPAAAYADPITVTGGVVSIFNAGGSLGEPGSAQLLGDGLRIVGEGFEAAVGPLGLNPGQDGRVTGSFTFSAGHPFPVVVNDQNFNAF